MPCRVAGSEVMTLLISRDLLSRLGSLKEADRNAAMKQMLRQLPYLEAMDNSINDFISNTAFVPTTSGELRAPGELYDPRQVSTPHLLFFLPLENQARELWYTEWPQSCMYIYWAKRKMTMFQAPVPQAAILYTVLIGQSVIQFQDIFSGGSIWCLCSGMIAYLG